MDYGLWTLRTIQTLSYTGTLLGPALGGLVMQASDVGTAAAVVGGLGAVGAGWMIPYNLSPL